MTEDPASAKNASFVGSIPEIYDRYLGPLLFHGYAVDLAARVRWPAGSSGKVLELAAGTGILTEQLIVQMPADVQLTVTDLNPPMLAVAERRMELAGKGREIVWQMADATTLPFADRSFDAVVCQFGAMFFPDKVQAFREAHRVLRPGGQWLFNVWGSWAENRFASVVNDTIAGFFPTDPPSFYRVPFSLHDPGTLKSLVMEAGFPEPTITELRRISSAPSAAQAAEGLVRGNPVIAAIEERGTGSAEQIVASVAVALTREFGDQPLNFPTVARVVKVERE